MSQPVAEAEGQEREAEGEGRGYVVSTVRAAEPGPERPGPQGQEREL